MAKKDKRLYSMTDRAMLNRAQRQKDKIKRALAAFTPRFPWLDAAYLDAYQTEIDLAAGIAQNNTLTTDTKALSAGVQTSMMESKIILGVLFIYSAIAFRNDIKRQEEPGKNLLDKARNNTLKMMSLLQHAWSVADKDPYKTALLNRGYTQAQTDALLVTRGVLKTTNALLQLAKANNVLATSRSIRLHNIVFNRMRTLIICARIIYQSNAARLGQFNIYP